MRIIATVPLQRKFYYFAEKKSYQILLKDSYEKFKLHFQILRYHPQSLLQLTLSESFIVFSSMLRQLIISSSESLHFNKY